MKKNKLLVVLLSSFLFNLNTFAQDVTMDTVSIFSFNDFHGAFVKDRGASGAASLVGMINQLKANNPHPIVVSGGDNFSGSLFSRITRGEPLKQMFEKMKVELSAVGNHEFDWGLTYVADTAAKYIPFVSANILDSKGGYPSWIKPYQIVERTLRDGKTFRVAFVGLTTTETPLKTQPENVKGLNFIHPLGAAAVQILSELKKENKIDLIILLMHIGTDMKDPYRIVELDSKQLPFLPGVDAIISAHSHEIVLDKINNVPIIQAGSNGSHISMLQFQVRNNKGLRDISFIKGDTLNAQKGVPDPEMEKIVNQYMDKYHFSDIVSVADDDLIHDRLVNKFNYTIPGAYITKGYAEYYKKLHPEEKVPVVGCNHFGGIRASIYKGQVNRLQAGNLLPFGGKVGAFRFDGKRLKKLLNDGRHNNAGFLQTSDISMKLNKEGQIIEVSVNGKPINDNDSCIVVLDTYITTGGDGYDKSLFSDKLEEMDDESTTIFIKYLQSLQAKGKHLSKKNAPLPILR